MKKNRYKDQNKENYKKIIIVLFVVIFILMLVSGILEIVQKKNEEANKEIVYEEISSIREVIEYHKSKYISEEVSSEKQLYKEAKVVFCKPLYEGEKSNEIYFNELIKDCAKVLRYRGFKLIDDKNGITIKVICNGSKITSIIINDIEDYFIYTDSQISISKYKEIPTVPMKIDAEVLQNCINNNWGKDTYFGERDSIFDDYYIFFDEGIEVRIIDEKVYNIVFNQKYNKAVVSNCYPGVDFKYIKATLGEPTFEDEEKKVIGYKSDEIYVFFTEKEVSVYRNSTIDSDAFFKLADKYLREELDLLEFMNELTYLWPDYSTYEYQKDSLYISYPLKGIEIAINYGDINGILVYNNNKSTLSKISRYFEDTRFVGRLQTDLMFKTELQRIDRDSSWVNLAKEYENNLEKEKKNIIGESLKYSVYPELDSNGNIYKMKFISKFGNEPNRELNDGISTFLWATNDYFIFAKKGSGIYFYNLNTGKVQRIITGSSMDEFNLKSYKNGVLEYDDEKRQLQF